MEGDVEQSKMSSTPSGESILSCGFNEEITYERILSLM